MSDYEDIVGPSMPDPEISKKIRQTLEGSSSRNENYDEIRKVRIELDILNLPLSSNPTRDELLVRMDMLREKGYQTPSYFSWDAHQLKIYLNSRKLSTSEKLEDLLHPDAA